MVGWAACHPYLSCSVNKIDVCKKRNLLFQDIKGIKLIIGLWIAACLGFAIYVTISSEPYYYFISFMIGLNACQCTKIWGEPEEELEEAAA